VTSRLQRRRNSGRGGSRKASGWRVEDVRDDVKLRYGSAGDRMSFWSLEEVG
jgi:hypothetical protein